MGTSSSLRHYIFLCPRRGRACCLLHKPIARCWTQQSCPALFRHRAHSSPQWRLLPEKSTPGRIFADPWLESPMKWGCYLLHRQARPPAPSAESSSQPFAAPSTNPTHKQAHLGQPSPPPSFLPTLTPTRLPTATPAPTKEPTKGPTCEPTPRPTRRPTAQPTRRPTPQPTPRPTPHHT